MNSLGRNRRGAGLRAAPALCQVPLDTPPQPFLEIGGGPEIEFALRARDVQAAARLAVGLARIPYDLAAKAGQARDQGNQIANGYLAAGSQVDRFGAVVVPCGEHDRARAVFNVEKFAAGRAGAPNLDSQRAALD